jgi:hypothetical protein
MQKIPVVLSIIAFVGKHLFNRVFGVYYSPRSSVRSLCCEVSEKAH